MGSLLEDKRYLLLTVNLNYLLFKKKIQNPLFKKRNIPYM